jgi:hypothetical protein
MGEQQIIMVMREVRKYYWLRITKLYMFVLFFFCFSSFTLLEINGRYPLWVKVRPIPSKHSKNPLFIISIFVGMK